MTNERNSGLNISDMLSEICHVSYSFYKDNHMTKNVYRAISGGQSTTVDTSYSRSWFVTECGSIALGRDGVYELYNFQVIFDFNSRATFDMLILSNEDTFIEFFRIF